MLSNKILRSRISQEDYANLKGVDKLYWYRAEIPEQEESKIEDEMDKIDRISKTPLNLKLLSREKNLNLKAEALGLEKNTNYSKMVGL